MTAARKTHNQTEFDRVRDEDIALYDFVREFWPVIEPGKAFVDGRHIEAICKHLEAVTDGRILRLLVNIAPRHAKSTIISVFWRVWSWIKKPWLRWLCASYSLSLSIRDNVKCRRLILSQQFQDRFGHIFALKRDQNAKIKFENSKLGVSQAVSVGSSATGEGGDILLIDDPHSIDEKRSDVGREEAKEWFKDTWYTRRNDPLRSAMVVVGQRIHSEDVSGYILSGETGEEWVHLNLATEFEPLDRCVTRLPDGTVFWEDWRELEGELLWEPRFPRTVIDKAKRRHGPFAYAALYQQRPVPAKGGIFDQRNERMFTENHDSYFLVTPRGIKVVKKSDCEVFITVDPAISEAQSADYTVIGTWAQSPWRDLLLLNIRRDHWSHGDQQDQIEEEFRESHAEYVAVETVAYQSALFQDLMIKGVLCKPFTPKSDKVTRSTGYAIWHRNGKCYVRKAAPWLEEYNKELYKFPRAAKDDQVDMSSLAGIAVRSRGPLSEDIDEHDIPVPVEESEAVTIPLTVPFVPGPDGMVPDPVVLVIPEKTVDDFEYAAKKWGDSW